MSAVTAIKKYLMVSLLWSFGSMATSIARAEGLMTVTEINGYQLAGAEYWPFFDDEPFQYPNDVLWGFYPEAASTAAVTCAETSYNKLIDFFNANPLLMRKVIRLGATNKFYLWTNDYQNASPTRERREASMWHWNSGEPDYAQGYWKWEATLNQDGTCEIPNDVQIRNALRQAVRDLND